MFGVEHIISPVTTDEFWDKYWGERALYVPGAANKFEGLFGWDDVNDLVNYGNPSPGKIRLVLEKNPLPTEALQNFPEWLSKGATLIINSVQKSDPVVERFASALSNDLNTIVNINSYASSPSKQGFDIHFDGHDVFVIQAAGEKEWVVFEPTFKWPLEKHSRNRPQPPDPDDTEPYLKCTMSEGDMLYIPRGHWHYALSVSPCIHLTVGPQSRSAAYFLSWLAEQLSDNDEFFRQDIPVAQAAELGGDRPEGLLPEYLAEFRHRFEDVLRDENLFESLLRFSMQCSNERKRAVQLPHTSVLRETITPQTAFTLAADEKPLIRYDEATKSGVVLLRGASVNVSRTPPRLLEAVFHSHSGIRGADALTLCPDTNWEQVKALLLSLYDRGLIFISKNDEDAVSPSIQG